MRTVYVIRARAWKELRTSPKVLRRIDRSFVKVGGSNEVDYDSLDRAFFGGVDNQ
jgi:hypothetical protein